MPGANEDSERISKMILDNIFNIHEIIVTLDSHHVSQVSFSTLVKLCGHFYYDCSRITFRMLCSGGTS